jgi:hypothetical protein
MTSLTTELETILRRFESLDASAALVDHPAAESALASYLSLHNTPRLPFRWAVDAHHAFRLVIASDYETNTDKHYKLYAAQQRLEKLLREKGGSSTEAQMANAPSAGMDERIRELWRFVRQLVIGRDVSLSVPWALYHPLFTPDRGQHQSAYRYHVWYYARNLIDLLSSSAHQFMWWRADTRLQQAVSRLRLRVTRNLLDAYEAGLWQFWVTATEIIALPRPTLVLEGGRLHAETGPAVSWQGSDERYFFLNGVHVSEEIVETPANRLDPRLMLFERSADVRREIIRKVGIERVCEAFNAQCVDRLGDYELLLLDLRDGRVRPFLKMKNPSIGVYHIEGVAPECRTVAEAIAWRNQSDVPPSVLT